MAGVIKFNRALNSLDLCYNDLGEGSETIAQAVLQHPAMEVFCNIPMKEMRGDSLEELDLSDEGIGAHGAMVIAPLLEFSRSLTSVNLKYNFFPDEGKQQLRDAVKGKKITLEL